MPDVTTYAAFVTAVLAMQVIPGPETMLVVSRGIGQGRRVAVWTVLAMTPRAGAIQLPLLALGVASVVRPSFAGRATSSSSGHGPSEKSRRTDSGSERYGIMPLKSARGVPNARSGATSASPSSGGPS